MRHHILAVATVMCFLAQSSQAALIAHYRFDEDEGAAIAANALGGTSGVIGSSVVTGVAGKAGNAYRFGGATASAADCVDMGNAAFLTAITASGQLTFSAWINTTDTTGNRNCVIFAGNDTTSNVYTDLGVAAGQAGALGAASARNRPVNAPAGDQQTGIYSTPVVAPVNDGQWHHLVMTVNLSTSALTLYVDGVLANSQTMGNATFPAFNNFEIGRLGRSSPTDVYQGLVDDVQVYDEALSLAQVQYLHANPGAAVPEPGALALAGAGLLLAARRRRA